MINLTWDPPIDNGGSPILSYRLYRATNMQGPFSWVSTPYTTIWSDSWVISAGQTYYYMISAVNAIGVGENSTIVSGRTLIAGNDTDSDGLPDQWEDNYGLDRDNATDAALDKDGDGYTNLEEFHSGSDPTDNRSTPLDLDGDGMPNQWEDSHGLDKYGPSDSDQDNDGDGKTNLQEYLAGTDPNVNEWTGDDDDDDEDGPNESLSLEVCMGVCVLALLLFIMIAVLLFFVLKGRSKEKVPEE